MLPGKLYTPDVVLEAAWRHRWVIVLPFVVAMVSVVAYSRSLPNLFKSETLILVVPQRVPESYVRSTVTTRIEDRLRSIRQQILSRTRLEQVVREFDLYPDERRTRPMEAIVEMMRPLITVEPIRGDAFRIEFIARDSVTPAKVVTRLAGMFIEEDQRDRAVLASDTNDFLESQLVEAKARLVQHERKLEEFRLRYAGELPSQFQSNLQMIQATQNQVQALLESINRDRDRRLLLEKSLTDVLMLESLSPVERRAAVADAGGMVSPRSFEALEAAQAELRALESRRLKPDHPDMIAQRRIVEALEVQAMSVEAPPSAPGQPAPPPISANDALRRNRQRQIQSEIDKIDVQIAAREKESLRLQHIVDDYQKRVEAIPSRETEMTELMRDYDTLHRMYTGLLAKKEESNISANLERKQIGEQFKVLDPARSAEVPFSPNRLRMNFMGSIAGLLFGLTLAALLEYRDTALRTQEEVVRLFALPVLAVIPVMESPLESRRRRLRLAMTGIVGAVGVAGGAAVLAIKYGILDWPL